MAKEDFARFGQGELAGCSIEQLNAELFFKAGNTLADNRFCQPNLLRGLAERTLFDKVKKIRKSSVFRIISVLFATISDLVEIIAGNRRA